MPAATFPVAPPPLASAPFVDENGRLQPWAIILLTQIINGTGGEGGIIDLATLGAFAQQVVISQPTTLPPFSRLTLRGDDVPPTPRSVAIVTLANGAVISDGYGDPNVALLVGGIGDLFLQRDGGVGSALWVCEAAGTGGWQNK